MTPFDDLPLLRAFVRIVESGSISAAARSLRVPQPSLSRQLRALEDRVGATLLQRDTHHLSLTTAGDVLLESARELLAAADDATDRLRAGQSGLQGPLRVCGTIDSGQTVVTRLLTAFLRAHPGVTAELSYSNRPVQMIEEGYDLGLVAGHVADERLVVRPLLRMTRQLLGAPALLERVGAPACLEALTVWPWATLASRQFGGTSSSVTLVTPGRGDDDSGDVTTVRFNPVFTSEGVISLRECLLSGLAIGVLPEWLAHEDVSCGRLLPVLRDVRPEPLPFNCIYFADRRRPARVQAFIDYASAHLPAMMTPP
jgi:DNA-binding transcriptional LysR family regulator